MSNTRFEKILVLVIKIVSGTFLAGLFLGSLFSSAYVSPYEILSIEKDFFIKHIIAFAVIIFIALIAKRCMRKPVRWLVKIPAEMPIVIMMVALSVYAIRIGLVPGADQLSVCECAKSILAGDLEIFEPTGYLGMYPHQKGIALIFAFIFFVAGEDNYLAIQLINVLALGLSLIFIIRMTPEKYRRPAALSFILFWPIWFYVTFIYGTMLGLLFATASLYFLKRFHDGGKAVLLIPCVLCAAFSAVCKSNYIIFIIAVLLLLAAEMIFYRRVAAVAILALAVLTIFRTDIIDLTFHAVYDSESETIDDDEGIPMTAWTLTGISFTEPYRGPGWASEYYGSLYLMMYDDREALEAELDAELSDRLEEMSGAPLETVKFFAKKTVTQWCEPTFESLWIQELMNRVSGCRDESLLVLITDRQDGLTFRSIFTVFEDIFQTLVYFGALYFIITYKRINGIFALYGIIIFCGGFMFHFIWEAKGEYTIIYFIMLIPYAAIGFRKFLDKVTDLILKNKIADAAGV